MVRRLHEPGRHAHGVPHDAEGSLAPGQTDSVVDGKAIVLLSAWVVNDQFDGVE